MSGGGAQQGQAAQGGMQQPLGGGMGGGFGMNNQQPMPQPLVGGMGQAAQGGMGGGFGMNNQQPMGGGMQQQLPPQMQPQMSALLQGGGFGMGQNLQGGMQQPLAAVQGGMPIRAPNGNFGVPGGMGGGLPAQGGGPMGLTQQQIDKIRQQMQNEPGDTFIPQGNSQGQSFGNMLSGLSPEFRAGLLGDGMRAQVQLPAGGPAAAEFYANYLQNQGGMPMQEMGGMRPSGGGYPSPDRITPSGILPIGLQPNPQMQQQADLIQQQIQAYRASNPIGQQIEQLRNQVIQSGGRPTPQQEQQLSALGRQFDSDPQMMQFRNQMQSLHAPLTYANYVNSLMGGINAGQPGIPSTQGGLGSLGPMRSTPTPAAPTPPTQTAPTRPEPRREFRTTNLADKQAKIQGAQDQMNRMRSMGVGGARDYISQIMGRR